MPLSRRTFLLLAALGLAGCGKIEGDLSSPDATSWCDDPRGGEADRVSVTRSREADGTITLNVAKTSEDGSFHLEDRGDDGAVDDVHALYWQGDIDGYWTRMGFDGDGDGMVDLWTVREFDEEGNLLSSAIDSGGDGTFESSTAYTYDDQGRLASRLSLDAGGQQDSLATYSYDDQSRGYTMTEDDDADGIADRTERASYSADGTQYTLEVDEDGDGATDRLTRSTSDAEGRLIESALDEDGDGAFDWAISVTYISGDDVDTITEDTDGDGDIDLLTSYSRDANGNWLSIEVRNPEGVLESKTSRTHDGELTTQTKESYTGGILNRSCWETSAADELVGAGCDENGDGELDSLTTIVDCN